MHGFAPTGLKADNGPGMLVPQFGRSFLYALWIGCGGKVERFVKDNDKVVFETFGHTSVVVSVVTYNLVFRRNNLHIRPFHIGVDHHLGGIRLRKGETKDGRALRRCHFGHDIIVGQIHPIIIRCRLFGLMREPTGTLYIVKEGLSGDGHERKRAVIVNPRTGLMGLLEAPQLIGAIGIGPSVAVLAGLRHPEVHAPRHGDGRIGVAGGQRMLRLGAHKRAYVVDGLRARLGQSGRSEAEQHCRNQDFFHKDVSF